jgi:hypothetical protein
MKQLKAAYQATVSVYLDVHPDHVAGVVAAIDKALDEYAKKHPNAGTKGSVNVGIQVGRQSTNSSA